MTVPPSQRIVVLSPAAARDLDTLPAEMRVQVAADLGAYATEPRTDPPRVKQLKRFNPPLFRLRSGNYRALFRLVGAEMHVYRIIDRKDLDRTLKHVR